MARKSLGAAASGSSDILKLSDLGSLPGWQNGPSPSRIDTALYQPTGFGITATSGTVSPTAGTLYAMPFICSRKQTYTHIGARNTAVASTTNIKMAIYNDAQTKGQPGTLLLDASGTATLLTTAGAKEVTINQTLTVGLYWLVINLSTSVAFMSTSFGFAIDTNFNSISGLIRTNAYANAFVADESTNTWTGNTAASPIMWLRS